jgi:hypothetical protein
MLYPLSYEGKGGGEASALCPGLPRRQRSRREPAREWRLRSGTM